MAKPGPVPALLAGAQRYEADADLGALADHPKNPRRGDDAAVGESIDANGFYGAIVAQSSSRYILVGHTRRRQLQAKGARRGPVLWLDVDDATAERIMLADNRTAELATWDDASLLTLLDERAADGGLEGTGFTADALAALSADLAATPEQVPDDPDPRARRKKMARSYADNEMRQIVLVYQRADYDAVVEKLEKLRRSRGADSYAAVIAELVAGA